MTGVDFRVAFTRVLFDYERGEQPSIDDLVLVMLFAEHMRTALVVIGLSNVATVEHAKKIAADAARGERWESQQRSNGATTHSIRGEVVRRSAQGARTATRSKRHQHE